MEKFYDKDAKGDITFKPNIVFKYGKYDHLEETLKRTTLKTSKLEEYNDPFETTYYFNNICDEDKCNEDRCIKDNCKYYPERDVSNSTLRLKIDCKLNKKR